MNAAARRPPASRVRNAQPAKPVRPVRDRAATERLILGAVGEVLAREGFAGIGVNAIAAEAGVDKVLIYRYFGGLPELLQTWGASGRFWPDLDELTGPDPGAFSALPAAQRYARFLDHFVDGLRARPLTLTIMAAEIGERNALTAILETEREQWGEQAGRLLGGPEFARRPELRALTLLLIAGVQYLLIRSLRIRVFGGIDLRSDAGWAALKDSVRVMSATLLAEDIAPKSTARRRPAGASRIDLTV